MSLILSRACRLTQALNRTRQIQRFGLLTCKLSSSVPSREIKIPDFIIPDPPPPPELLPLAPITAKTFKVSMWLPTGWICSMLLYFENYMPYYVAIMAVTLVGRSLLTPIMIFSQRQSAKMGLVSPKIQEAMKARKEAEQRGDKDGILKATHKMAQAYKSTDAFKIRNMVIPPLCSIAVFGSFFIALRKMAYGGHEAMKEGGFGPFVDLTVTDPSYLLPTWTALTLYGIMKIGIEYGAITAQASSSPVQDLIKKGATFVVPAVIFYASTKMPAAVGLYWATNNTVSIGQSLVMLNPSVRKALKIAPRVAPVKGEKRSIFGSVTQSWTDMRKAWKTMMENRAAKKINNEYLNQFDRSGVGPLQKTFDYDPTKVRPQSKSKL